MPKTYFRGTYSHSADGMYHTSPIDKPKAPKNKPAKKSERAVLLAENREIDAEVCRRCTKPVCKGSKRCVEKERARQEKERQSENEREIHD